MKQTQQFSSAVNFFMFRRLQRISAYLSKSFPSHHIVPLGGKGSLFPKKMFRI